MRTLAASPWLSLFALGLLPAACTSGSAAPRLDAFVDATPVLPDGKAEPGPDVVLPDRADARLDAGLADLLAIDSGRPDLPPDAGRDEAPVEAGPAETPMDVPADSSVDAVTKSDLSAPDLPLDGAWPGSSDVANASVKNAFGTNLSGLVYQPAAGTTAAILWAVQNEPSKVFRLAWNGTAFVPVTTEGWGSGKSLAYPSGTSGTGGTGDKDSPDSEGLTRTEWDKTELYVASEHDNAVANTSRLSILRYDLAGTTTTLTATHEWNLTPDLPKTEPNLGLEAIAWIPDTFLVERGFYDERAKAIYDPAGYVNHGSGIFLVGMEGTGMVYGYVLDHVAGTYQRVATFSGGQSAIMDLAFDRDTGTLWAGCDGTCDNNMTLLDIDTVAGSATKGRFMVRATVAAPPSLRTLNNEGITLAPESECANGLKPFFWADDDETNGYAIRRASVLCGRLF